VCAQHVQDASGVLDNVEARVLEELIWRDESLEQKEALVGSLRSEMASTQVEHEKAKSATKMEYEELFESLQKEMAKKEALIEKYAGLVQKHDASWSTMIRERENAEAAARASIQELQASLAKHERAAAELQDELAAARDMTQQLRAERDAGRAAAAAAAEDVSRLEEEKSALVREKEAAELAAAGHEQEHKQAVVKANTVASKS